MRFRTLIIAAATTSALGAGGYFAYTAFIAPKPNPPSIAELIAMRDLLEPKPSREVQERWHTLIRKSISRTNEGRYFLIKDSFFDAGFYEFKDLVPPVWERFTPEATDADNGVTGRWEIRLAARVQRTHSQPNRLSDSGWNDWTKPSESIAQAIYIEKNGAIIVEREISSSRKIEEQHARALGQTLASDPTPVAP